MTSPGQADLSNMWNLKEALLRNKMRLLVLAILLASVSMLAESLIFHLLPLFHNPPALSISPGSMTMTLGQPWRFSAVGGVAPFTFSIVGSGGSIDGATGIYTADFTGGYTIAVRVTDAASQTADATVTVGIAPTFDCATWSWLTRSDLAGRVFDSGGSGGNYANDDWCIVEINTGTPLTVHFNAFDTETSNDVLSAFDSIGNQNDYSGTTIPADIVAADGYQRFQFVSNSSIQAPGYDFSWSAPYKIVPTLSATSISVHISYSTFASVTGGIGPYTFSIVSGAGSISNQSVDQIEVTSQTAGNTVFRVTDAINQTSDVTINFYADALNLSSVNPLHGGTAGGEPLFLNGTGILQGAVVTIGGNLCTAPGQSDSTSYTCTTPAGTEGAQDIVITNPGGATFTLAGGYSYDYGSWSAMTTPSTVPRSYEVSIWTGDRWIIWGGANPSCAYASCAMSDGYVYNPATDSWSAMAASPLAGRVDPAQVWTGHEALIIGGRSGGTCYSNGAKYDPYANSWTSIASPGWSCRQGFSQAWTGKELIAFGGQWGGVHGTGAAYNPATNSWRTIASGTGRWSHQAIWTGSKMITYGGASDNGWTVFPSTMHAYDPEANSWSTLASPDAYGHYLGTWMNHKNSNYLLWTGDRIMLSGNFTGGSGTYTDALYNPTTNSWTYPSTSKWNTYITSSGMVWTGDKIIRISSDGTGRNHVEAYDPATASTSFLPDASENEFRTIIWTGKELLTCYGVMPWYNPTGGTCRRISLGGLANRLASLSADSWIANSSTGAPSARSGSTSIWTGKYLIVWGGYDGTSYLDDGYKYDPFTDVWTTITTTGAPSGRHKHTAIWTGSKMLIWGGQTAVGTQTNTGGLYDPATDSWTSTPTTGSVPSAREDHTADWTGGNMIVWGGRNSGGYLGDGATYNLASNSWSTLPTTGSPPSARSRHRSIFTGAMVVIWGGDEGGSFAGTGASYDLTTQTWTALSNTSAPSARADFSIVLSQGKLVVWGGVDSGGTATNTGGLYNLSNNTWTATSTSGAPSARSQAATVYTDRDMVVWGGKSGSTSYADGYLFDPRANSWTAMSSSGLSARYGAMSAWTGEVGDGRASGSLSYRNNTNGDTGRLIIWGGYDDSTYKADGKIYNLPAR